MANAATLVEPRQLKCKEWHGAHIGTSFSARHPPDWGVLIDIETQLNPSAGTRSKILRPLIRARTQPERPAGAALAFSSVSLTAGHPFSSASCIYSRTAHEQKWHSTRTRQSPIWAEMQCAIPHFPFPMTQWYMNWSVYLASCKLWDDNAVRIAPGQITCGSLLQAKNTLIWQAHEKG